MIGTVLFCIVGGWIILAEKDTLAYFIFISFTLWIYIYHIERISYVLLKYVLFNNYEIRYMFGKSYDDFAGNPYDIE